MPKNAVQLCLIALVLGSKLNLAEETNSILKDLQAECTHEGIRVKLWFQKEFNGIAYSNGYYETEKCRYIPPPSTGTSEQEQAIKPSGTNFTFLIPISECGTVYHGMASGSHKLTKRGTNKSNKDNEIYIENTLLIQNDPTIQEAGDLAKTLRCVWQKEIHRPLVASFPFVPVNATQDQIKSPQRLETVSSSFQSRYGPNPHIKMNDHKHSTSTSVNPKMRLRFQKKGQVQSVPNRRYFSRSLHDDERDQEESGELISIEYGGEEVFSDETNNDNNNMKQQDNHKEANNVSLSPVSLALPLRTSSNNQISSNSLASVHSGSHSSQFLITYQSIFAVILTLRISFLIA